jgi:hypothetical protein
MRILSRLKNLVVAPGREPRKILGGPFKGIIMDLSLRSQTQVYLGLFEREVGPWLRRLSGGLATVIDIGAGEGEYTLFFLIKTKVPSVHAFEPDADDVARFFTNLRLNELDCSERLNLSTAFVGTSDGDREIRLDTLAKSLSTPCFIKMDVDGAEERILQGATALNALPDVRWLIETHSRELETACVEMLTATGFQTRIIPNAWWRVFIPELRPIEHNRWLAAWKMAL